MIEKYSLLVTIISTLFCIFSLCLTYIGYVKFKAVDKIVKSHLKKSMSEFTSELDEKLILIQNANSKINASYNCFHDDIDSAINLLSEAEEIYPLAYNLYNTFGYAYEKKNDKYMTEKMFLKSIELHPKNIQGYNDLANFYKKQGQEEKAKEIYNKAVKVIPNAKNNWQEWN